MAEPGADPLPAEEPAASLVLRLYVAGSTARSGRTVAAARRILESRIPGRYSLAVVDIYQDPEGARMHQIVAAPTLIRLRPLPVRRLIGDLSDEARVLAALGLAP
ncbi:MAG: circadian clock KaiB family protein [Janthinobacterium lividum]